MKNNIKNNDEEFLEKENGIKETKLFTELQKIPNELYKEVVDKDGQKIVFDFKDLDKSKEEYIRLTQDEYGKLKECAIKRKKVNKVYRILGVILFILGILMSFYFFSRWLLLALAISLVFIVRSTIDYSTPFNPCLYGYSYDDAEKYMDVNMRVSDIISILALEEEFWTILEVADIDTESASKFEVDKDNIDFLYVDSLKMPHTMSFNLKGATKIYYENIDYILILGLSITLPLKYSDRYKKLVD